MKIKITKKMSEHWSSFIGKYNKPTGTTYGVGITAPIIGDLWWTVPEDVFWLYSTQNDEGYEGSQTQFGVKQDGTIVWGFFSHCSCYGYEDYDGEVNNLTDENEVHTRKTYKLNDVDNGVLLIMKQRLKEISKLGLKDDASLGDKE